MEVLGIREGQHALRFITTAGTRISLHATALGRALLATLPPAEAAELLARRPLKAITPHTTTSPATLQRALQAVRLAGYAWVDGEGTEGVAAMAVAGRVGDQPLGLSITGPSDRLARHRADYGRALREVAARVFDDAPPAGSTPPTPLCGRWQLSWCCQLHNAARRCSEFW